MNPYSAHVLIDRGALRRFPVGRHGSDLRVHRTSAPPGLAVQNSTGPPCDAGTSNGPGAHQALAIALRNCGALCARHYIDKAQMLRYLILDGLHTAYKHSYHDTGAQ